ncbi:hypothetical protein [Ascidiaceihabitans donghaensis]|uniref:hypothetical protein n=1 Tax=Ascidiaceihabitans donghaensis TaxID=1510460 RepID=UPI000D55EC9D|nr:hypothetical protein [Ascidiaceihabitans donghaensis]
MSKPDYFDDAHVLGFIATPTAYIRRRTQDLVKAGEDILTQNSYAVPYFEGLDSIGPKRVQERNAAIYGNHDEDKSRALNFMTARGTHLARHPWGHSGRKRHLHTDVFCADL